MKVESSLIRLDREGAVATVTVDRPEARNALTSAMRGRIRAIFDELGEDRDVRVAVLRGAGGKSFVSGADIHEFLEQRTAVDVIEHARADEELYRAVERFPGPVIAAIEGYCLGGGLALAAACDLRICTADSQFGITSAKSLGNANSPGIYARLAALLGIARTKELLICAPMLSAEKALEWGIVNEMVEADALEQRLEELTAQLASHAPLTMWAAKEAMRRLVERFPADEDIMEKVFASRDFREGVDAFVEKRKPEWRNE